MNSGACGGNDGNGGKDKNGKSPEELHREYIKQMDILRRREEVRLKPPFFKRNIHIGPCSVIGSAPGL